MGPGFLVSPVFPSWKAVAERPVLWRFLHGLYRQRLTNALGSRRVQSSYTLKTDSVQNEADNYGKMRSRESLRTTAPARGDSLLFFLLGSVWRMCILGLQLKSVREIYKGCVEHITAYVRAC
jgi:hypothetical protein